MHESTSPQRLGRPTALTPELAEQIVRFVRHGNYLEVAAAAAGIARSTLFDWLRRGARETRGPYRDFSVALRVAQAETEATDLALVALAARKDWRAAAWRLQHRFPARWGGAQAADGPVEVDAPTSSSGASAVSQTCEEPSALNDEDYAEAAAFLLRRKRARSAAARDTGAGSSRD